MQRPYRYYDIVMAVFVSVLLLSNIASAAKLIDWGIAISLGAFHLPLAFDAGTLLFPISYIFGDILTEVYGYKRARRVIWVGFALSALMAATFWLIARLPGSPEWGEFVAAQLGSQLPADVEPQAIAQAAYDAILGGVSSGAIIAASLIAYWAGEFTNSYVLARLKVFTQGRWLWTRTIGSTLVGQAVDTLIFVGAATILGVFPPTALVGLVAANYIFKVGIEVILTPVTYLVVNFLKRAENEDYFDTDTDFNPFKVGV